MKTIYKTHRKPRIIYPCLFLCLLLANTGIAQQPKSWEQIAAESNNFYEIKAAFMQQNAATLAAYEKDVEDFNAGRIERMTKGKYPGIKPFLRWAEWHEPRVKETNGDMRIIAQKEYQARISAANRQQALNAANWSLLGPVAVPTSTGNGRINNIRIDPANPNVLYACTPASQLFKSVNGGTSWLPISHGIPSTGVTDLAIDPTNTNILYALTGDGDQSLYHPNSVGVYKSTDGGSSWSPTGLTYTQGNGVQLTNIIINPAAPNTIIVSGTNGIRRSVNGGATFTQTSTVAIQNIVFQPGNPNVVFAGSKYGGVFLRSVDNGVTWTQITAGLPTSGVSRYAIDVSPANPNYVYAMVTNTSNNMEGFYKSINGGLNFTQMSTTPNIGAGQGWYDFAVCADPASDKTVYACGVDVFKSIDTGKTWTNMTNVYSGGTTHPDMHDLTFSGASTLYLANDGGVYRTTNAGVSWTNISSNLSIAQPYAIGLSANNPNTIISGLQDNGTILTNDLVNWRLTRGGDGMISFIDRTNDNIMYSSYQNGGLGRSTNGGASWVSVTSTIGTGYWVTPFIQDPVVPNTVYCGTSNVFKSVNNGTTWVSISPNWGATIVRWLAVDKRNTQIIYAMTPSTIYKTTNGGTSWATAATGLPGGSLLHIHIDENDSNTLYASMATYTGNSVYRTTDGGANWLVWATGLPTVPAITVVTQTGSPGEVYCGTDIGVYYRDAAATSWSAFNTNLPVVPVRDLEIFYPTGKLRAGTFGRGIWETPLNTPSVCPFTPAAGIAYVNALATGGTKTGTSWANAYLNLDTALAVAKKCDYVSQIWVAAGTYKPTTGTDRNSSFSMVNKITIYGGFPNTGNPTFAQRNVAANITTLSGDIGAAGNADNSYHVISNPSGLDTTAMLDGFTIADGNANTTGGFANVGGGMLNNATGAAGTCNPKIVNCIFMNNNALLNGGAVYNNAFTRTTSPLFTNCVFKNNTAQNGGVLFTDGRSAGVANPVFTNCTFSNNSATGSGTVANSLCTSGTCTTAFANCIFFANGGATTFSNTDAAVSAKYSLFEPLVNSYTSLAGNLTSAVSPFVLPNDFHLSDFSPAIDAGTAAGAPAQDIEGTMRTAIPDIGAYENRSACGGANKMYYSDVTGTAYQWQKNDGSGWVDLTDGAAYSNVTTPVLTVINPAAATTGLKFRCGVITGGGTVYSAESILRFYNRWQGTANNSWLNAANWSCGAVPDQYTDVIVPSAKTIYPLTNVSGTIRKLMAENGSSITITTGSNLIIAGKD